MVLVATPWGSNNMWDLPSKMAHSIAFSYHVVNMRIWKFGRACSFSRSGTFVVHRMSKIQLKYSVRVRLNVEGYC